MKLIDIVKTVGAGAVRDLVPGGGVLINAVNEFLPEDYRLPSDATGRDVENALGGLSEEDRARVMEKEFDVDVERIKARNESVQAMLKADAETPHTTRPYIAKHAFHVVALSLLVVVTTWSYGIVTRDSALVDAVTGGWQFVLSVIGPFITLLWAYFGVLRAEQKNRLDAANGRPPSRSFLDSILKRK